MLRKFLSLLERRDVFYLALMANIAGTIYGWYYYRYQLLSTPPHLWFLVTDSPNSTLFFVVALVLMKLNRKNDSVSFFASANLIKYGLWTDFVLLFHRDFFFAPERYLLYSGIFVTHFLMAVEALPLAYTIGRIRWSFTLALIWLLGNDYVDYFHDLHPYIPEKGIEVVTAFTIALSLVTFSALLWVVRVWSSKKPEKAGKGMSL